MMEDVSMAQAVPSVHDSGGQVPDQFKDSPLLRVPMFTQQGERSEDGGHLSTAQMQRELSHMQDQINVMQHQLQHQPQPNSISPQLPGSPLFSHVVPREYGRIQNQQVPLSPQHPQINFGEPPASLHRNVVEQQIRQQLPPPQTTDQPPQQQQQPQQSIQPQNQQQMHLQQHFNQQQQAHQQRLHREPQHTSFGEQVVRKDAMMSYLMDSLNVGQHIGHYGCLVFAIIAHHFMTETAVINYLLKDPNMNPTEARTLYDQVQARDYNPPRRDKTFPIIPPQKLADQEFGNVYKDLRFPDHVYEHISTYYSH